MSIYVNARFLTQPVSGVQRYALECSRKIKKMYPKAVFLCPHNIYNADAANELQAVVVGKHTGHLWEQTDLPRYLKQLNSPPLFNPCNTAPLVYKNNYTTLHDLAFHHYPGWNSRAFSAWYNWLIPKIVKRSSHIFTVSNTMKKDIVQTYGTAADKISVTYNGISEGMFQNNDVPEKEKIVLSVGSFNMRKNHHLLIRAFTASKLAGDYQLVIVGEKNKVFRETGIDEASAQANNIVVHNAFDEASLIKIYQKAALIVSLSAYEGFGIPILEGIHFHCKAVCSDIPTYRELFGSVATFCNPNNIDEVCRALETAANDTTTIEPGVLTDKFNYSNSAETILQAITRP